MVGNSLGHKMGIKDLPITERPREKAMRYGFDILSNVELLALIIGSGSKGVSALDIAYELVNKNNGLANLIKLPYQDFLKVKGLSKASALKIEAVFELFKRINNLIQDEVEVIDETTIFNKYRISLQQYDQEILGILILNRHKKLLCERIVYKGTKTGMAASIREIFKELLLVGGTYFYIFHNHPSGEVEPSRPDAIFTEQLIEECSKYGFTLVDHLIISNDKYFSFSKNKTIHC